jgi:hypothetical protein
MAAKLGSALRVCQMKTEQLAQRILSFVEHVAAPGGELYSYQRAPALRIIMSLLINDGANITVLFSRQSGKSEAMADIALGLSIICPVLARLFPEDERLLRLRTIRIGIFGPNQEATAPIYQRIREKAESDHVRAICAEPEINMWLVQSRGDSLTWNLGSYVKAKTASEAAYVEGQTYHLILIDEAQKVDAAKVDKQISPMRAATNGTMVKVGTAFMSRGGFHNDIQNNIDREKRGEPKTHFEFDYEVVIREKQALYDRQSRSYKAWRKQQDEHEAGRRGPPDASLRSTPADPFHLMYAKFIEAEVVKLGGTDNETFKMNFRLLWQESFGIALSDKEIARAGLSRLDIAVERRVGVQVAGLDVAKMNDASVLTIMDVDLSVPQLDTDVAKNRPGAEHVAYYSKTIIAWAEFQGSWERMQYPAISEFLSSFAVRKLCVDTTGAGDPVAEALELILEPQGIEIEGFKFSSQGKHNLYSYFLQEWRARRVHYPASATALTSRCLLRFVEQLSDLAREWKNGLLTCFAGTPEGHDDYPDSAALATWAAKDIVDQIRVAKTTAISVTNGVGAFASSGRGGLRGGSREERYQRRRM